MLRRNTLGSRLALLHIMQHFLLGIGAQKTADYAGTATETARERQNRLKSRLKQAKG